MSDICPSVTGDMASSGNITEESEGEDQDDRTNNIEEDEDQDIEEEVLDIIDERVGRDGKKEYQVLWKSQPGGSKAVMTWEPEENLTNCAEVLSDWEEEKAKEATKEMEEEHEEAGRIKAQRKAEKLPPAVSAIKLRKAQ